LRLGLSSAAGLLLAEESSVLVELLTGVRWLVESQLEACWLGEYWLVGR
jgi:hypothetical protein